MAQQILTNQLAGHLEAIASELAARPERNSSLDALHERRRDQP
ncbi:MAG TPA: hypothetical protein VJ456_04975 [Acidimicrobiia bacterium]|nr:hypothetical protein [Acidimicrobiia bacterium]